MAPTLQIELSKEKAIAEYDKEKALQLPLGYVLNYVYDQEYPAMERDHHANRRSGSIICS